MNTPTHSLFAPIIRLLLAFAAILPVSALGQGTDWAFQATGISGQPLLPTVYNHVTSDASGNLYVSSNVVDSTEFGSFTIHGYPVVPGVHLAAEYLAKFNSQGEPQWVQTFTGPDGLLRINDLATDPQGNVYFTGHVSNQVTIDTISIVTNFTSGELIVAKFNPQGEVQWVKTSDSQPGFSSSTGASIAISPAGDVVVSGFVSNEVVFDSVTLDGTSNQLLVSYDSAGNLNWVNSYGTQNPLFLDSQIGIDGAGDIYWVGSCASTASSNIATFDTIQVDVEHGAAFLAKFDADGDIQWINSWLGALNNEFPVAAGDLAVDRNTNAVYIGGIFRGSFEIAGTTLTETSALASDMFVARFSSDGTAQWARQSHGPAEPVRMYDLSVNSQGELLLAARVFNSAGLTDFTLGEGANAATITLDGPTNGIVAKYTTNGDLGWMKAVLGTGGNEIQSLVAIDANTTAITGFFTGTATLGTNTLVAGPGSNSSNIFVATCTGNTTTGFGDVGETTFEAKVYPNLADRAFTVELEDPTSISQLNLMNPQGQVIRSIPHPTSFEVIQTTGLSAGIYLLRIHQGGGVKSQKVIIKH